MNKLQSKQLFSKEALEKLRLPERLDTLLSVTAPISWMLLTAILIFVFSIIIWSIFGAFTVKAEGMGLITGAAGIVDINHIIGGKVMQIYFSKGDIVKRGDIIAQVINPETAVSTAVAQHQMRLAGNDKEAAGKAYEYQQIFMEDVYSYYNGIVEDFLVTREMSISQNVTVCTVRLTRT